MADRPFRLDRRPAGGTKNVAPEPTDDSTPASPPCARAMAATIESPRPVPPLVRALDGSARKKRSKTFSRWASDSPGPVSVTSNITSAPIRRTATWTGVPAGVWVRALLNRLLVILMQSHAVAGDGHVAVHRDVDRMVLGDDLGIAHKLTCRRSQIDALPNERAALIESGEQQQVVDQHAHAFTRPRCGASRWPGPRGGRRRRDERAPRSRAPT